MKKLIRVFIASVAFICILAFSACGKDGDGANSNKEYTTENWGLGAVMPEKNGS